MATFVPRFLRQMRDILISSPADTEVLTYDVADGKWKNLPAGGGGGLTFAQILAAFAAIGDTFDPLTGAVTISPSSTPGLTDFPLKIVPPADILTGSYIAFVIDKVGGGGDGQSYLFALEADGGIFVISTPGEGSPYFDFKGDAGNTRFGTGFISGTGGNVIRWSPAGIAAELGFFNQAPATQPAAPTTMNEMVAVFSAAQGGNGLTA